MGVGIEAYIKSRLNVQFLKTDPKARYQGYAFYFREGFRWSAINGTRSSNDLKFCFKAKSVNDVQGMSLCCVSDVITPQYVTAICNSNFISRYTEAFINSTVIFQINDCRQIPIIIPNKDEIIKFSTLFERAKRYVKSQTPDMSYLNNLQLELDDLVLQLYRL